MTNLYEMNSKHSDMYQNSAVAEQYELNHTSKLLFWKIFLSIKMQERTENNIFDLIEKLQVMDVSRLPSPPSNG